MSDKRLKIVLSNDQYFAKVRYEKLKSDRYWQEEKVIAGFCRPLEVEKTVIAIPGQKDSIGEWILRES